jgi:AcrR family transcriptional regulator
MSIDEQLMTKRRILSAARRLFHSPGYQNARVVDIATAAGVSRATVYNHFVDKEAILRALVEDYLSGYARISESMVEAADRDESIFAVLLRMVEDALAWRVANADLRPAIEIARQILPDAHTAANRAADDALRKQLADVHRRSVKHGIVRPDIDLNYAATALYSMIEAVLSSFDVGSSEAEIKAVAEQLTLLQWYAVYTISPEVAPNLGS